MAVAPQESAKRQSKPFSEGGNEESKENVSQVMEKIYAWFGGRKMFLGMFLFVLATLLFIFSDKTDFAGWSELVMWIFGIYAVGNVGEHLSDGLKTKQTEQS